MPAPSKAAQRAAGAAEHMSPEQLRHAGPVVQQMADSMNKGQLHDMASGPMKGKPEHVKPKHHKKHEPKHEGRSAKPRGGNPY